MPLSLINLDPVAGDSLREGLTKTNQAIDVLRQPHTITVTGAVAGSGQYTPENRAVTLTVNFAQTVWTSANDGDGSGLDADLLDGQQGTFYRNAGNLDAGTVPLARLPQGEGAGMDADLLDAQHGAFYRNASNLNAGTVSVARLPIGAGNGIDADLLDGKQGAEYVQIGAANTFTANNTINGVLVGTLTGQYQGFGLAGWAAGSYVLVASSGADKNTYLNAQSGGSVIITPNDNDQAAIFSLSASSVTYGGYPVYHARNLVRGIDDPGQSIGYAYSPSGQIISCTRIIAGQQCVITYKYDGAGLITRTTVVYAGRTRTYTNSFTSGRITSTLINEV